MLVVLSRPTIDVVLLLVSLTTPDRIGVVEANIGSTKDTVARLIRIAVVVDNRWALGLRFCLLSLVFSLRFHSTTV